MHNKVMGGGLFSRLTGLLKGFGSKPRRRTGVQKPKNPPVKERVLLYGDLAVLGRNDSNIPEGCRKIYDANMAIGAQFKKAKKRMERKALLYKYLELTVRDGKSLSKTLQGMVPDEERLMVFAGEKGTGVHVGLEAAAKEATMKAERSKRLKAALAYPIGIAVFTIILLNVFGYILIPTFAEINPQSNWNDFQRDIYWYTRHTYVWLPMVFGVIGSLFALIRLVDKRVVGGAREKIDEFFPFNLMKMNRGAGFISALGNMVEAGVNIKEALGDLEKNSDEPWTNHYVRQMHMRIRKGDGKKPGAALSVSMFSPEVLVRFRIYAEASSTQFAAALGEIAQKANEEALNKVESIAGVVKYVMLGVAGLTAAVVFLAMYSIALGGSAGVM